MTLTVRGATAEDAEAIGALGAEFMQYLRDLGDPAPCSLTAAEYLRDGFGERPAFAGLVAEAEGETAGFLLYHEGYDLDRGGRVVQVIELYVRESARGHGAGRALMEAAAEICRGSGGREVLFAVYPPNAAARAFYERLGARYTRDLLFMHWPV